MTLRQAKTSHEASTAFVGRRDCIATMARERVIIVRAEGGAGKSHLLEESRRSASEPIVVTVRCHRGVVATYEPLETVVELGYRRLRSQPAIPARHAPIDDADRLVAIRARLESIAASEPLLVQIDDLHWAPQATIDAIAFCIDRTRDSEIRWHLATRPSPQVEAALESLRRDEDCHVLDVPLLDEAETAELARVLTGSAPDGLHRLTGGNPLYIEQWLAAREHPSAATTLRATLEARLSALPVEIATVAAVLAVANRALSLEDVSLVLARPADGLRGLVASLESHGIVRIEDGRCEFTHDLLRDACVDLLSESDRTTVHGLLADVARSDEERALHLNLANRIHEASDAYLRAMMNAVASSSFTTAAALADRLRSVPPLTPDRSWQLDAVDTLVRYARSGYPSDRTALMRLLASADAVDEKTRAFYLERLVTVVGRPDDPAAQVTIDAAIGDDAIAPADKAIFFAWKVKFLHGAGDYDHARETVDTALATADPESEAGFELRCLRAMVRGRFDPAAGRADLRALAEDPANERFSAYPFAYLCTATLEQILDRDDAQLAAAKAGLRIASTQLVRVFCYHRARAALNLGRIAETLEACAAADAWTAPRGFTTSPTLLVTQCEALTWLGELERAGTLLARAWAEGTSPFDRPRLLFAAGFLAEARDRLDEAVAQYELVADRLEATADTYGAMALANLTRIHAIKGRLGRARLELARLKAGPSQTEFSCRETAEAEFYVAVAEETNVRERFEHLAAARVPVLSRALALAHLGERLRDRNALLQAIGIFDSAGASVRSEDTRRIARALGFRPGSQPLERRTLTDRETDIVRLIAEGQTNREIADRLHLSPKTIAANIGAVLEKCGLRSRVEIAARVAAGMPFTVR